MNVSKYILFILVMICLSFESTFAQGGRKGRKNKKKAVVPVDQPKAKKEAESPFKDLTKVVKKMVKSDGLFLIYRDTLTGEAYLNIKSSQIGQSFIYFSVAMDGSPWFAHFRGYYRDNYIFTIERYFDRLRIIKENTAYYFDETNALSRASKANLPPYSSFSIKRFMPKIHLR